VSQAGPQLPSHAQSQSLLARLIDEHPNKLVVVLAIVFGLSGFLLSHYLFDDSGRLGELQVSDQLIKTIDGKQIKLLGKRDRPVLINFWATWCPPCVKELPVLQKAHQSGDLHVVTIATDARDDVVAFAARLKLKLPIGMVDDTGTLAQTLKLPNTIPYSVLLTPDGKVIRTVSGEINSSRIAKLLSETDNQETN
jgi:thiol-disulfide isomerase/thioredoxin